MTSPSKRTDAPALRGAHGFVLATTAATLVLLASGALVTSHGAGLAVPDWPTTFGYNMFAFPVSRWVGGVFFEHVHRLVASVIAALTAISTVLIWRADTRRWVKALAVAASIAVILQAVLGGLRVVLLRDEIGIFHALLAQSFFVLLGILSVVTSRAFLDGRWAPALRTGGLRWLLLAITALMFCQLGIAATMRHAHAGLSIPDFPSAYGQWLPDTGAEALAKINAARLAAGEPPASAAQIWLQMAHRLVAAVLFIMIAAFAWQAFSHRRAPLAMRGWALVLLGMVIAQIALGAWTIWSNKAADVATAHMTLGALMLFVCGRLSFQLFAMERGARVEALEFPARRGRGGIIPSRPISAVERKPLRG